MFQPEKFSDYLSIAAILISCTSLVLTILNYRRQGGLLKFDLDFDKNSGQGMFVLKIENMGFHAVKISQIRMIVRDQVNVVEHDGFQVDYGDKKVVNISLAGYKGFHPIEVSRIEVVDIGGQIHKISTRKLRARIRH